MSSGAVALALGAAVLHAGWNVLLFHYRGMWGTSGAFSLSSAIEDVAEAVRFLRDPANAAKYRIDPQSLVVIGHSFGAFLAGYEGAHDPDIRAVAMISAVNLGRINADPKERESRLKRWETQLHPVRGATASGLFVEAGRHSKDWDYVQWAAIRQKSSVALEHIAVQTDHSFSDRRIALQTIVIEWLEKLKRNASSERR